MPKSSTLKPMPSACRRSIVSSARAGSASIALSVISKPIAVAGHLVVLEDAARLGDEPLVHQHSRGEVDRHADVEPARAPRAATGRAASASTFSVRPRMWSPISASGMNSSGATSPYSGCRQRASASTPATDRSASRAIGWYCDAELAVADRIAECVGERQAPRRVAVERGVVHRRAEALALRLVHRYVGAAHQLRGVDAVHRRERRADRGVDPEPELPDLERLAQARDQLRARSPRPRPDRRTRARSPRTRRRRGARARPRARRAAAARRGPISLSSWSPAKCPSASLISLKWSRSIIISASRSPVARAPRAARPAARRATCGSAVR